MCFPPDSELPRANSAGPGLTWQRGCLGSVPAQRGQEGEVIAHRALHTKAHFAMLLSVHRQLEMEQSISHFSLRVFRVTIELLHYNLMLRGKILLRYSRLNSCNPELMAVSSLLSVTVLPFKRRRRKKTNNLQVLLPLRHKIP